MKHVGHSTWGIDPNGLKHVGALRRTQSLMLISDGCPLKTGATNKILNYKLVLQAARQVLAKKKCTNFIEAMESAFGDPS